MGFASALRELSLPKTDFFTSIIMFNIGVELGQITIILAAYLLVGHWFKKKNLVSQKNCDSHFIDDCSSCFYWTIERVFDVDIMNKLALFVKKLILY